MREASVRLRIADPTGNSVGSGTIVDFTNGVALIVTCGHVFRDSQGKGEVLVDVFEPYRIDGLSGRVVDFDLESDVGLVICRSDRPLTAVRVAGPERPVTKDEPVIGIGCNHGEEPTVRQGRILAVNKFLGPPNLQVSGQPVQGRSGGGLFSMESQLIGVCNAADPSDDAGLFAAAANIHALLDRTRLGHVYRQKAGPSMAEVASETSPGTMPRRMPEDGPFRLAGNPAPAATGPSGIRERAVAPNGLDAQEQAFLTEIARTADDAEVICIIRPRSRPDAKSQILVLDSASPAFIQAMSALTSETEKRALTLTEERQHEGRPLKWKSRASPAGSGQREAASNRQ
jgi:S1-C subfamily serine protease